MGEPLRARLAVPSRGAGDAAAELVDAGRFDGSGFFVQVSELPVGVCGERGRGGAIRDAVAAGGCGGGHQLVADRLAEPGAQPRGQPGAGGHRRQRLGECLAGAPGIAACPALFPPAQPDLPVSEPDVARRGGDRVLGFHRPHPAVRAAPRLFLQVRAGHHVHGRPAVVRPGHRRDREAGKPEQHGCRRAPRHAAGRGLLVPGAAGSVHGRRFLLRFPVLGRNENCRGTAFLSRGACNSQPDLWKCG